MNLMALRTPHAVILRSLCVIEHCAMQCVYAVGCSKGRTVRCSQVEHCAMQCVYADMQQRKDCEMQPR
jgi:hypothetical protein